MAKRMVTKYKKVVKLSIERRGEIIEKFTYLEMIMDNIISRYFCATTEKTDELTAVLLSTIDFSKKKDVVFYILDCHSALLNKYKTLKQDLETLNQTRNIFAHKYLAIHDDNVRDEKLCYIKFVKGKPTEIEITLDYFNHKISLLDKCDIALSELSDIVRKFPLKKSKK